MVTSFELRAACQSWRYSNTLGTKDKLVRLLSELDTGKEIHVNYVSYGGQVSLMTNTSSSLRNGRLVLKKHGQNHWNAKDSKTLIGMPSYVDTHGAVSLLRDCIRTASSYNIEVV